MFSLATAATTGAAAKKRPHEEEEEVEEQPDEAAAEEDPSSEEEDSSSGEEDSSSDEEDTSDDKEQEVISISSDSDESYEEDEATMADTSVAHARGPAGRPSKPKRKKARTDTTATTKPKRKKGGKKPRANSAKRANRDERKRRREEDAESTSRKVKGRRGASPVRQRPPAPASGAASFVSAPTAGQPGTTTTTPTPVAPKPAPTASQQPEDYAKVNSFLGMLHQQRRQGIPPQFVGSNRNQTNPWNSKRVNNAVARGTSSISGPPSTATSTPTTAVNATSLVAAPPSTTNTTTTTGGVAPLAVPVASNSEEDHYDAWEFFPEPSPAAVVTAGFFAVSLVAMALAKPEQAIQAIQASSQQILQENGVPNQILQGALQGGQQILQNGQQSLQQHGFLKTAINGLNRWSFEICQYGFVKPLDAVSDFSYRVVEPHFGLPGRALLLASLLKFYFTVWPYCQMGPFWLMLLPLIAVIWVFSRVRDGFATVAANVQETLGPYVGTVSGYVSGYIQPTPEFVHAVNQLWIWNPFPMLNWLNANSDLFRYAWRFYLLALVHEMVESMIFRMILNYHIEMIKIPLALIIYGA